MFKYSDTNSSRANIEYLNQKFHNHKIAIVGLGGTGSYILDFVSKTPVKEIHLYDNDTFELHNAFRAPGAISEERMMVDEIKKVSYYKEVYSNMHKGIFEHIEYVTEKNIHELSKMDFVFISVDKNEVRSFIIKKLIEFNIPFVDTGLGVNVCGDTLIGTIRLTYGSGEVYEHLGKRIGSLEFEENDYFTNIQIAELNGLNAAFAILKWKKSLGFYQDLKGENNTLFFLNTNKILNEDHKS